MARVSAVEASAHLAPLVAAQNIEVMRRLLENERRMLLDRIEPLEQHLPSASGLEALAQRLWRVEQQCSVKTAHPLDDASLVSELKAELRTEMANHIRTLAMKLRGEILGEFAVRQGQAEVRVRLVEVRLTGDLKKNIKDLGMRIDQVEDEVKRNSKLATELEERTSGFIAMQGKERDIRGALPEEDAKRGDKFPCSPTPAVIYSTSSNGIVHKQSTLPALVESGAADLRSSERTNSDRKGSVRLVGPQHSNFSYRQPPLVPTGETSLGDEDFKNIQDGVSPLSDGLAQSLQALVSVGCRTSLKKDGSIRSAVRLRTSSVPVRISEENEVKPTVKTVSQCERRPIVSSKSHSPGQDFITNQEHIAVTNQLDSESSTTQSAMRLGSSTGSAATPSIVSPRPKTGSAEIASTLSRLLAHHRSSRQTTNSTVGSASPPKWASSTILLRPRISTMGVEPTHSGRTSPGTSPAISFRSSPTSRLP